MERYIKIKIFAVVTLLVFMALYAPGYAKAATITLVNADGPNEGFNDPALGQQRINAFNYAAGKWAVLLDSDVDILVEAKFDPLPCNAFSAVVGSAGTNMVIRDFPGPSILIPGIPRPWPTNLPQRT